MVVIMLLIFCANVSDYEALIGSIVVLTSLSISCMLLLSNDRNVYLSYRILITSSS